MDVSIIIVAWNRCDLLQKCLESVYEHTRDINFEVIYVDNASTDRNVAMVQEQFPDVRIIQNDENRGFTKANNQAIQEVRGRYVLLLNSDTVLLNNAVSRTAHFADQHPDVAVVGCQVLNPDMTIQRNCFMFFSILNKLLELTYLSKLFPRHRFFGRKDMRWWSFNDVRPVDTVVGCFSMVRKEAIDQVGVMDEHYFFYCDDMDWCYRFKKQGWKVMFCPEGRIIHYGGQTSKSMVNEFTLQLRGSELIFVKKHQSLFTFYLTRLIIGLHFYMKIPYWLLKGVIRKVNRQKLLQVVQTCLKGGWYCWFEWKKLVMNPAEIQDV